MKSGELSTESEECSDFTGSELEEEITWIEWFCHLKGDDEFFVEVDEDYIQDDFNLTGLSTQVPYYEHALNMILDFEDQDDQLPEDQQPLVETAAQMLYGLIHARFILTNRGMQAMLEKVTNYTYGTCPNYYCEQNRVAVLPIGTSDLLRQSSCKVYCAACNEIYFPKSSRLDCLDGAYFGSSFAHLYFMVFPHLLPTPAPKLYVPKMYGFKVHKSVRSRLWRKNEKDKDKEKKATSPKKRQSNELQDGEVVSPTPTA
jgi:casein kinase II subunit beta